MLEVSRVYQEYRTGFFRKRTVALSDVSIQVPRGSVFGFLGPNGAGKTTLIQLIVGNKKPVSGQVTIEGEETHLLATKRKIGYLPERPYFYSHLTAYQFLKHHAILSEVAGSEIDARIDRVLGSVDLKHARDKELGHFSKGMLQRVGIAQAIIHDPKVIVLDEPMSGLDPIGRREIRELIHEQSRLGKTVFFSTHVVSDVEAICDRVAIIRSGKITHEGKIFDLVNPKTKWVEIGLLISDAVLKTQVLGDKTHEIKHQEGDQIFLLKAIQSNWNADLSRWISQGARVTSVIPQRPSLEELFT